MRHDAKPSMIGSTLGYPPDGKRFGRVLVEIGLRDSRGRPTADTLERDIVRRGAFKGRWEYDIEAVIVRVMGATAHLRLPRKPKPLGLSWPRLTPRLPLGQRERRWSR